MNMQQQNQPSVQNVPQGVAHRANEQRANFGKYTPSDTGLSNLLNASPENIGFDFDQATGNFQLVDRRQQQQSPVANTQPNGQQTTNGTVAPQPNSSPNGNVTDPYNDRFAAIDNQFQAIGQALQRMAGYMESIGTRQPQGQQQQQQDQQQVTLDLQSEDFTTNLLNVISTAIDRKFSSFREEFAPIKDQMRETNSRFSASDLAMKYGQAFVNLYPTMLELKKSDPNLDFEKTYLTLSKLQPSQDSTIRTDNGSQQQAQVTQPQSGQNQFQNNNQQLQQRANQLSTETGGVPNSLVNQEAPIASIADAVNKSFRDLGLG